MKIYNFVKMVFGTFCKAIYCLKLTVPTLCIIAFRKSRENGIWAMKKDLGSVNLHWWDPGAVQGTVLSSLLVPSPSSSLPPSDGEFTD